MKLKKYLVTAVDKSKRGLTSSYHISKKGYSKLRKFFGSENFEKALDILIHFRNGDSKLFSDLAPNLTRAKRIRKKLVLLSKLYEKEIGMGLALFALPPKISK